MGADQLGKVLRALEHVGARSDGDGQDSEGPERAPHHAGDSKEWIPILMPRFGWRRKRNFGVYFSCENGELLRYKTS